jgi:hypothetical protein
MAQKLYVEKPGKVLAEQYLEGTTPDAAGVHRCGLHPQIETGPPHVHAHNQVYYLHDTDWILTDHWTHEPTGVLTDAQFQEMYGAGPPLAEGGEA